MYVHMCVYIYIYVFNSRNFLVFCVHFFPGLCHAGPLPGHVDPVCFIRMCLDILPLELASFPLKSPPPLPVPD